MAEATAPSKKEVPTVELYGQTVREGSKEHKALSREFDPGKKYMFRLAMQNLPREIPVYEKASGQPIPQKQYPPFRNIVFSSQIVFNGSRTNIRYYDGCETIFVSGQPKEKDVIDQLKQQTKQRFFLDGKFGAYGDEKMLLLYMHMCSWNGDSEFRTMAADSVFVPVDKTKQATETTDKLDKMEKALKLAKEASETKMLIHASYLGIPDTDYDSGNPHTPEEIKVMYREAAAKDPSFFIESYGNKAIEYKFFINKALMDGTISNKFNPNKATWGSANKEICDISGLKSTEAIAEKLLEFSQLEAGQEFAVQLRNLYSK